MYVTCGTHLHLGYTSNNERTVLAKYLGWEVGIIVCFGKKRVPLITTVSAVRSTVGRPTRALGDLQVGPIP